MPLASLLNEATVITHLEARNKSEVLRMLVDRLVTSGRLEAKARDAVIDALEAREKVSSTALEFGIAIPHATVDAVTGIEAVLAVAPGGVPFDGPGRPLVNLVILLLIPPSAVRRYSSTLAGIARLMAQGETRAALLQADSPQKAFEALRTRERLDLKEDL